MPITKTGSRYNADAFNPDGSDFSTITDSTHVVGGSERPKRIHLMGNGGLNTNGTLNLDPRSDILEFGQNSLPNTLRIPNGGVLNLGLDLGNGVLTEGEIITIPSTSLPGCCEDGAITVNTGGTLNPIGVTISAHSCIKFDANSIISGKDWKVVRSGTSNNNMRLRWHTNNCDTDGLTLVDLAGLDMFVNPGNLRRLKLVNTRLEILSSRIGGGSDDTFILNELDIVGIPSGTVEINLWGGTDGKLVDDLKVGTFFMTVGNVNTGLARRFRTFKPNVLDSDTNVALGCSFVIQSVDNNDRFNRQPNSGVNYNLDTIETYNVEADSSGVFSSTEILIESYFKQTSGLGNATNANHTKNATNQLDGTIISYKYRPLPFTISWELGKTTQPTYIVSDNTAVTEQDTSVVAAKNEINFGEDLYDALTLKKKQSPTTFGGFNDYALYASGTTLTVAGGWTLDRKAGDGDGSTSGSGSLGGSVGGVSSTNSIADGEMGIEVDETTSTIFIRTGDNGMEHSTKFDTLQGNVSDNLIGHTSFKFVQSNSKVLITITNLNPKNFTYPDGVRSGVMAKKDGETTYTQYLASQGESVVSIEVDPNTVTNIIAYSAGYIKDVFDVDSGDFGVTTNAEMLDEQTLDGNSLYTQPIVDTTYAGASYDSTTRTALFSYNSSVGQTVIDFNTSYRIIQDITHNTDLLGSFENPAYVNNLKDGFIIPFGNYLSFTKSAMTNKVHFLAKAERPDNSSIEVGTVKMTDGTDLMISGQVIYHLQDGITLANVTQNNTITNQIPSDVFTNVINQIPSKVNESTKIVSIETETVTNRTSNIHNDFDTYSNKDDWKATSVSGGGSGLTTEQIARIDQIHKSAIATRGTIHTANVDGATSIRVSLTHGAMPIDNYVGHYVVFHTTITPIKRVITGQTLVQSGVVDLELDGGVYATQVGDEVLILVEKAVTTDDGVTVEQITQELQRQTNGLIQSNIHRT